MEFSRENKSAAWVAKREGYQRHLIRFAKNGLSFDGERVDLVLFQAFWVLTEKLAEMKQADTNLPPVAA